MQAIRSFSISSFFSEKDLGPLTAEVSAENSESDNSTIGRTNSPKEFGGSIDEYAAINFGYVKMREGLELLIGSAKLSACDPDSPD